MRAAIPEPNRRSEVLVVRDFKGVFSQLKRAETGNLI
jgi:hypothetical protein